MQLDRVQAGTLSNCPLSTGKRLALLVKAPRAVVYCCPQTGLLSAPAEKPAEGEGQEKPREQSDGKVSERLVLGGLSPVSPDIFQSER